MRLFRVVYTILAANFIGPTLLYAFAPDVAMGAFSHLNEALGGGPLPPEVSVFWRVLGVANVGTLGFCCALLLVDLRRWYAVVVPLVFLKAFDAVDWGAAALTYREPAYVAAFLLDLPTAWALWYFPRRARRELGP
jgi:hypothetical protein